LLSNKKNISSLKIFASMLAPKTFKNTQICQFANEFILLEFFKTYITWWSQNTHKCMIVSRIYMTCNETTYFIFGKWIIVEGPYHLCSTHFFSKYDMNLIRIQLISYCATIIKWDLRTFVKLCSWIL
jgi:hypothetical protein